VTGPTPGQAKRSSVPVIRKRAAGTLTHTDMGHVVQVPGYGKGILWGIQHVAAIGDIAAPWTRLTLRRTWHGTDEVTRGLPPETRITVLRARETAATAGEEKADD
jgi:hypothetical protein